MTSNRFSTYTTASTGSGPDGESKSGEQKKDLWSSMLDSVASGKRLPEKNILVLGTNCLCEPDQQSGGMD
jgi:dynein light intermediate chain 1, cytosolic